MAGRDSIFYRDWRNKKRERLRLLIIPAQAIGTIVQHEVWRPAWGASPAVESKYVKIGRYTVYAATDLESGFEDRPIGMADAASMTIGVNATRLESAGGDLALLPGFLLDPQPSTCRGRIYRNDAHTQFRVFPTPNVAVLTSDRGDSSLDVSEFYTEFVGAQRRNAEDTIKCRRKSPRGRIDCTFVDVVKYTLENVIGDDISRLFLDLYGDDSAVYKPGNAIGATQCYYNDIWKEGNVRHAHCIQTFLGDEDDPNDKELARYYRTYRYWTVVARLVDNAYHEVMKHNYTAGNRRFRFRYSGDTGIVDPTPFEHITLYKKLYDAANTRGDAISRTDLCFNGVIWSSGDGEYDDVRPIWSGSIRESRFVGGFLVDHSGEGSHYNQDIANLWDYLSRATKLMMRCEMRRVEPARIDFWFCRLYDLIEDATPLFRRDIRKRAQEDVTVTMRKRTISGSAVAIPNGSGRDVPTVEVRDGTLAEEDQPFTLIWHNLPKAGDPANRYQMRWDNPDLQTPFVAGASETFNPLQLAYFDSPADISHNEIPIRPHDQVGIDLGTGTYIMGQIHSLPTVEEGHVTDDDDRGIPDQLFDSLFWLPVRTRAEQAQKTSCLAWSLARRAVDVFGSTKQWEIAEPIRGSKMNLDQVGSRFILTNPDGSSGTLGILLSGSTLLDGYPFIPYCVKGKKNVNTGQADAEILGVEQV